MEIIDAGYKGYKQIFPSTYHVFNSADFNVLNEARCEQLLFLIFKDTKNRLGLITLKELVLNKLKNHLTIRPVSNQNLI